MKVRGSKLINLMKLSGYPDYVFDPQEYLDNAPLLLRFFFL